MLRDDTQIIQKLVEEVAFWRAEAQHWHGEAERLTAENAALRTRVCELESQVGELTEQVATLSKMLFGRTSEKTAPQPPLGAKTTTTADDETEFQKRGQRPGSTGHGRRDYSHLETEDVFHDVSNDEKCCRECGAAYSPYGEETCEQIDWIVKITRVIHHRRSYRRNCSCDVPGIVIAPPVPKAIAKGRFTSRFLARLCIEKFCFGMPVNRIVGSLGLVGAEFSTGTLTGSLKAVSKLLEPLDRAIRARNAQAGHLHVDETSWSVFAEIANKDSKLWWLWVFVGPDTTVFRIEPSRSMKPLNDHLGIVANKLPDGHEVIVSSDFYTVYRSLNQNVEGFDSLWCWAHIRRYFIRAGDAHKELRQWRDEWVLRIAALYGAHSAINDAEPESTERYSGLQSFDRALQEMDIVRKQQSNDDTLHEAAHKVLATLDNEWDGLIAHQEHIELPLDNNGAERALRTPVVGRKNYNGSGAVWSAELASRSWTTITTAQRWGLNPLTYLTAYIDACGENAGKPLDQQGLKRYLPWTASQEDLNIWRGPPP